ncbi:MAG: hypothetical protein ACXACK_11855 [Candidatus Hodarchaeales archaeon]
MISASLHSFKPSCNFFYLGNASSYLPPFTRNIEEFEEEVEGFISALFDLAHPTTISKPVNFHERQCGYTFRMKKKIEKTNGDYSIQILDDKISEILDQHYTNEEEELKK